MLSITVTVVLAVFAYEPLPLVLIVIKGGVTSKVGGRLFNLYGFSRVPSPLKTRTLLFKLMSGLIDNNVSAVVCIKPALAFTANTLVLLAASAFMVK